MDEAVHTVKVSIILALSADQGTQLVFWLCQQNSVCPVTADHAVLGFTLHPNPQQLACSSFAVSLSLFMLATPKISSPAHFLRPVGSVKLEIKLVWPK